MRRKDRHLVFLLVSLACVLAVGCDGTGEIYQAYVDKIEPPVPGLTVKGLGIWGQIRIWNNTGADVYVYDSDGQERYKITPSRVFIKNERGEWVYAKTGNEWGFSDITGYNGSVGGLPAGRYRGQVMREWVIAGRAGDTPFKVYGRTVYEPPQ